MQHTITTGRTRAASKHAFLTHNILYCVRKGADIHGQDLNGGLVPVAQSSELRNICIVNSFPWTQISLKTNHVLRWAGLGWVSIFGSFATFLAALPQRTSNCRQIARATIFGQTILLVDKGRSEVF